MYVGEQTFHPQLEHRRETVAPGGAGCRERLVGGSLGWSTTRNPVTRYVGMSCLFLWCSAARRIGCRATPRVCGSRGGKGCAERRARPRDARAGGQVRPRVRGGSGPTAVLIYFTFSDPGPGQPLWFHIRLADTRSGEIVGAATIALDSLTVTPRARAVAAIKALAP